MEIANLGNKIAIQMLVKSNSTVLTEKSQAQKTAWKMLVILTLSVLPIK